MSRPIVRRFVLVMLLALTVGGIAAVSARADAPDVKVSSPPPGQHPTQTGVATVDTASGHVTVDLTGGWSWPTHGKDCNTDRAGAGVAVNWFDPTDRGFHVTQNKKAVSGIHVRITGPKLNLKTKASNSKGVVKQVVKMKKAGVLIFSPIASKRCNTKRVGITNVFTPPVTG